jgi:hypothetical protein
MQYVANTVNLHYFYCVRNVSFLLDPFNSSSFFTRSVQLILLNAAFAMTILELILRVRLLFSLSRYENS